MKIKLLTIIVIILLLTLIGAYILNNHSLSLIDNIRNNQSNNLSLYSNVTNVSSLPTTDFNSSLVIPPNDYVINHIDWSSYPNLQIGYVYLAQICEPNEIVSHKFIGVEILTEVKGTDNNTLIKQQLGGIAIEARRLYGPNSAICILGTSNGVVVWTVTMYVFDDKVYY